MDQQTLDKILKLHEKYLWCEPDGKRAVLQYVDLSNKDLNRTIWYNADLRNTNFSHSNLSCADLSCADLRNANLHKVDLSYANLSNADLRNANLHKVDLSYANLSNADLRNANLIGANLKYANLYDADLSNAKLTDIQVNDLTRGYWLACPEKGEFIGYKKANRKIVVLKIPADAKRTSATTLECRCDKAVVLRIENLDGSPADVSFVPSDYNNDFIYQIGKTVSVKDFDDNRWNECGTGIHFFTDRQAAVNHRQ